VIPSPFQTENALLQSILYAKKKSIEGKKRPGALEELQSRIRDQEPTRSFQKAITRSPHTPPRLIAEIKKASPSKGILREKFDPVDLAKRYEEGSASALSVLTEEDFFLGKLSSLAAIKSAVSLPLLQKDFILDPIQIYEARAFGADAVLLILSLLTRQQAIDYFRLASELALHTLVEVHTELEWAVALDWAPIIGINNRDLKTFQTDIRTTTTLLKIPGEARAGRCIVSESGIGSKEDVRFLADAGVDALLIGEAFMVSESIEKKMNELLGS
jgi:indole-3-glycerol phosphate synthase